MVTIRRLELPPIIKAYHIKTGSVSDSHAEEYILRTHSVDRGYRNIDSLWSIYNDYSHIFPTISLSSIDSGSHIIA
jgi:hypothetical protein